MTPRGRGPSRTKTPAAPSRRGRTGDSRGLRGSEPRRRVAGRQGVALAWAGGGEGWGGGGEGAGPPRGCTERGSQGRGRGDSPRLPSDTVAEAGARPGRRRRRPRAVQVPCTSEPGSWGRGAAPRGRAHVGGWAWAALRVPIGGWTRAVACCGSGREARRGDPQAWPRRNLQRPTSRRGSGLCPESQRCHLYLSSPAVWPHPPGWGDALGRLGRTWGSVVQDPTLPCLQSLKVSEELRPLLAKMFFLGLPEGSTHTVASTYPAIHSLLPGAGRRTGLYSPRSPSIQV